MSATFFFSPTFPLPLSPLQFSTPLPFPAQSTGETCVCAWNRHVRIKRNIRREAYLNRIPPTAMFAEMHRHMAHGEALRTA